MRILYVVMLAASCCACGPLPQTIGEQRTFIEARGRRLIEEWVASGDVPTMVERLRVPMEACFNGRITRHSQVQRGSAAPSSHTLNMDHSVLAYEDPDAQTISLAVQMLSNTTAGPRQPEGGMFLWHVDIEGQGSEESKLVYYGWRSGRREQADAVRAWSMGEEAACPPPD